MLDLANRVDIRVCKSYVLPTKHLVPAVAKLMVEKLLLSPGMINNLRRFQSTLVIIDKYNICLIWFKLSLMYLLTIVLFRGSVLRIICILFSFLGNHFIPAI